MRILLIDDQPNIGSALTEALRKASYAVDVKEGLYKAIDYEYDAILLGVMLPRIDGWQFLESLRKKKKTSFIMLTAKKYLEERDH